MPANHPNPRPAAGGLLLALLLVGALFIPTVSAETIIDDSLTEYLDTSKSEILDTTSHFEQVQTGYANRFDIKHIENYVSLNYIDVIMKKGTTGSYTITSGLPEGLTTMSYTFNGQTNEMRVYTTHYKNIFGTITGYKCTLFPQNWNNGGLTGAQTITLSQPLVTANARYSSGALPSYTEIRLLDAYIRSQTLISGSKHWDNHLIISNDIVDAYEIELIRQIDIPNPSKITLYDGDTAYFVNNANTDIYLVEPISRCSKIIIDSGTQTYTYDLLHLNDDPGTPTNATATVYIQSSQTGALLANANLAILASTGGTETEIINATLPAGTAAYTLQPTGGGIPNPDYYRAVATVPGYTQIVENHSFTLTGPHDVIIEMRPDSGGPTDPENCYLEFYVRDFSANGIASASIQCNSQFKQTNSAGYAVFEVAKNASYPYVVKKSGYVTIEGSATVADAPRYIANIVLGPGTVPTYTPTPDPSTGEAPGATPTPDRRTNEEKGQSIIDMIADNAEPLVALALLGTFLGLFKLMAKW